MLQYFGHLMWRTDSLEKVLMLGKIEGRRRRRRQRMRWLDGIDGHKFEQAPGVGDGQGSLAFCSPWGFKELDMTEWLSWTENWLSRERKMSLGISKIKNFKNILVYKKKEQRNQAKGFLVCFWMGSSRTFKIQQDGKYHYFNWKLSKKKISAKYCHFTGNIQAWQTGESASLIKKRLTIAWIICS